MRRKESVSKTEQVSYLIQRKFPDRKREPNPISISRRAQGSSYELAGQDKTIEGYRAELLALPAGDLRTLYQQEKNKELEETRKKEEANQNGLAHWAKLPYWTLDEAVRLSFGRLPDVVEAEEITQFMGSTQKEYRRVRDLALRAVHCKLLTDPVVPVSFLEWAQDNNINVPKALAREIKRNSQAPTQKDKQIAELTAELDRVRTKLNQSWQGFDQNDDTYPEELDIAMQAWRAVERQWDSKKPVKEELTKWLMQHYPRLSKSSKERISMVCNWRKEGGRRTRNE